MLEWLKKKLPRRKVSTGQDDRVPNAQYPVLTKEDVWPVGTKMIRVGDLKVAVPEYYRQLDSAPDDPKDSCALFTQSEDALCFVLLRAIDSEEAMPFNDAQGLIDGIHRSLDDDQGLIEVEVGGHAGSRYAYSIVKMLKSAVVPEGVQYTLTLDQECDGNIIRAQGFFDEQGTTGSRDMSVFHFYATQDGWDRTRDGWTRDPYDPDFKRGRRMNKSEFKEFDPLFPAHPLSMARALAQDVIEG